MSMKPMRRQIHIGIGNTPLRPIRAPKFICRLVEWTVAMGRKKAEREAAEKEASK
jgi:hypothetical protein